MKAYSLDFRCLVINAYESGKGTIAEVAEQFGGGTAFVKKLRRRHRAGESLEPQHGGGAQAKLNAAAREKLRAAVETRPDATLGELKAVLRRVGKVRSAHRPWVGSCRDWSCREKKELCRQRTP